MTAILDAELITGRFLREHDDIAALGARVVGQTPRETVDPWVRLTLLDARNAAQVSTEHLVSYTVQLDVYASAAGLDGSQQKEASLLARTIRAALVDDMPGTHDGAVVAKTRITRMLRAPDTDIDEPARERVILTCEITAHPA